MDYMGHLAKYPGLADWYSRVTSKKAKTRSDDTGPDQFVLRLCESLCQSPTTAPLSFADCMDIYFNTSSDALADYLGAEAIVNSCDETLLNIISGLGETAVRAGVARRFLGAVINAADKTGIIGLRFLSAWICLNIGDLRRCVAECEKVDEPIASIYTILGQALLELSQPEQAIEALQVAVKISPNEVLAWFQLAKAHYAAGNTGEAFRSLSECERIAPNNIEIALFQAIVANESQEKQLQTAAFRTLRPHLSRFPGDAEVVFNLLQLALKADDKESLERCLDEVNFDRLKSDNRFPKLVSPFLRALYERNWMALSARFLTGMTTQAS
jgi:tetratricopeptide (TPR) repeat protein